MTRFRFSRALAVVALVVCSACAAKLPPQASAQTRAIDTTDKVAKILIYVQDGAAALNNTPTKVLSDPDTAIVMHATYNAGVAMKAAPAGAKAIAGAVLQALEGDTGLSPGGKKAMAVYLHFAQLFFDSLADVTGGGK